MAGRVTRRREVRVPITPAGGRGIGRAPGGVLPRGAVPARPKGVAGRRFAYQR